MKAITFIAITLLAGAIAGTILGVINQVAVEPFIKHAIELEMQNTPQSDQAINPAEFTAYRFWQKGGEIVAGTILGLSIGSLFGIVFVYTHSSILALTTRRRSLLPASCVSYYF
jgi:predicted cobalt transporter CbtA